MKKAMFVAMLAGTALAGAAQGQVFIETEGNDTKAAANVVVGLSAPGNGGAFNSIQGNSIASTGVGVDYFDLRIQPAPLGIYRHRLVITTTGTAGHSASIRGLGQTAAPPDTLAGIPWDGVVGAPNTTESALQSTSTATTPARMNQWYGFGKGERFYYRINGGTTTTADYVVNMETVPVTPVDIGSFVPGQITMNWNGQGHTTDTDMWVFDSNFDPIVGYGNDDSSLALNGAPIATTSLQSWLARSYAEGTYYIGVSNFQMQTSLASASDDNFRTGNLNEFGGMATNSSTTTGLNLAFAIQDSSGNPAVVVPNTKVGAYDINWFKFTVVPTPGAASLLAMGGLLALRRRR